MTQNQITRALQAASATMMVLGVIGFLATIPATSFPARFLEDLVFWPIDGFPGEDGPTIKLLWAISGGLMAGWGYMLWQIAAKLYPQQPDLARSLIFTSSGIWFVVDSAGSVVAGAPLNVAFNVLFLSAFYIPLLTNRRSVEA